MAIFGVGCVNMMNNSAYSMMNNCNTLNGLSSSAGQFKNTAAVNQSEKRLLADNIKNGFLYQASDLQEKSQKKMQDEDIKRSFNTFA